jgi:hypothetical protein
VASGDGIHDDDEEVEAYGDIEDAGKIRGNKLKRWKNSTALPTVAR